MKNFSIFIIVFLIISQSYQQYLNFSRITVGKMISTHTQIPKNYYDMEVCKPKNDSGDIDLNPHRDTIGELFTGDTYYDTPFVISSMINNSYCTEICSKNLSINAIHQMQNFIDKEYNINFFVDKLPLGLESENGKVTYKLGIPLGFREPKSKKINSEIGLDEHISIENEYEYFIYNHYRIKLLYTKDSLGTRVVGGSIFPMSISNSNITNDNQSVLCSKIGDINQNKSFGFQTLKEVKKSETFKITFTYDVVYEETNIPFSSRWDHLLALEDDEIHWRPIILSLVITLLGALWVIYVFFSSVESDILNYNIQVLQGEFDPSNKSWKQLSYDVFRPPINRIALASFIGTGIQVSNY